MNDFVNTVSCAWHGAARAPGANCSISSVENIWIVKKLRRQRDQIMYFNRAHISLEMIGLINSLLTLLFVVAPAGWSSSTTLLLAAALFLKKR